MYWRRLFLKCSILSRHLKQRTLHRLYVMIIGLRSIVFKFELVICLTILSHSPVALMCPKNCLSSFRFYLIQAQNWPISNLARSTLCNWFLLPPSEASFAISSQKLLSCLIDLCPLMQTKLGWTFYFHQSPHAHRDRSAPFFLSTFKPDKTYRLCAFGLAKFARRIAILLTKLTTQTAFGNFFGP